MSEEKQMTPLQELIGILGNIKGSLAGEDERTKKLFDAAISIAIQKAQSLLPKEKQGIISAYDYGYTDAAEIVKPDAEQFFNEKYKQ